MLGGSHPDGPTAVSAQLPKFDACVLRRGNAVNEYGKCGALRKAFRENNKQPLQLGFDYADLVEERALRGPSLRCGGRGINWNEGHADRIKAGLIPFQEPIKNLGDDVSERGNRSICDDVMTLGSDDLNSHGNKSKRMTNVVIEKIIDYAVDPQVLLILGRPFLRTAHALIDVYGEELTIQVDDESITFKVGQTLRYPYNDVVSINRIDVIDVACEDSSPSLTPFEESDFILEEIKAFLTNDSIPPGIDDDDFDSEGDLLLLEKLLNDDPSSPLPPKELHVELELKDLPSHLEYAFLEGTDKPPIIIAKDLKEDEKVSPVHCVPKKGGITVIENDDNELIPTRLVTGWRVCTDYQKLNDATRKDHFPIPFMDQMLERLAGNEYYCFLDGFSGYFQIPLDPQDQEKTAFTCLYGTFAYRRMPFGLCNAPGTFQRCMMTIFHDMIEETMEVFMDDFLVFRDSFSSCLSYLDKMLKRCEDTNLVLNWEKCHFMVKEGIVLGHKISKSRIEVDKAKVDDIAKLPHSTFVKGT
ncbi:reverse transcriptase domain-containing protein [Tanacetum coccineum]